MLFFLENLLNLPKVNIRNVIQEGKQAFLILSCQEEEVKCNYCGSLTDELHQTNSVLVRDWVRPLVDKSCCNQGSTGNPY